MSALHCDIFCKVIDNFGDIGVCWRLARQLAQEHGLQVRLWVDDLACFQRLAPRLDAHAIEQTLAGVTIRHWDASAALANPADIVIEAFACDPPAAYIAAMATRNPKPAWINLEYLSAESWVEGSHALASPHPSLPLRKYFFFPGFSENTGALLRESAIVADLQAFRLNTAAQQAFWRSLSVDRPPEPILKASLFSYENPGLASLLDAWAHGPEPVLCAIPDGRIAPAVRAWAAQHGLNASTATQLQHGQLSLAFLPFLPQPDYDRLLAACDLNFVRGEDSLVRAQWAASPFVWHIYQQAEHAHLPKLAAFLDLYCTGLGEAENSALRNFWLAWENGEDPGAHWPALRAALAALQNHQKIWAKKLIAHGDLASKLLIFCQNLLECPAFPKSVIGPPHD